MVNGVAIDLDVMVYSCPPSTSTYMCNNMWAYRNHYKVDVEIGSTHAMYESGVACIFKQVSHNFVRNRNIVMANLHYVGVLKEIIIGPTPANV